METSYFMIIDGRQAGPFVREELKYHALRPDSMVWRQGLENWVPASSLPELNDLFSADVPPAPGYQSFGYGQFRQNEYPGQYPPYDPTRGDMHANQYDAEPIEHTNWHPWAIVCTVLGTMTSCITLILGIVGIVQANKANESYRRGNRRQGDAANSTAKTVTIIGLILAVVAIVGVVVLFVSGGFQHYLDILEQLD